MSLDVHPIDLDDERRKSLPVMMNVQAEAGLFLLLLTPFEESGLDVNQVIGHCSQDEEGAIFVAIYYYNITVCVMLKSQF